MKKIIIIFIVMHIITFLTDENPKKPFRERIRMGIITFLFCLVPLLLTMCAEGKI